MQTYINPAFPGKTFRRLEVGEVIREGDYACSAFASFELGDIWTAFSVDLPVVKNDEVHYYREITASTSFTTDQRLDLILSKLERIDAVLAGFNKEDND
jgi:hypothetical protein